MPLNPCKGYCSTSLGDEVCKGCGRNYKDVVNWNEYPDDLRRMKLTGLLSHKWKQRFMDMADDVAKWSKETDVKVGAIIVGSDKQVISQGYNGKPRFIKDEHSHPLLVEHAERNAIFNACLTGVSTKYATLFVTHTPCPECARAIIQCGISEVIVDEHNHIAMQSKKEKWQEWWALTESMFEEARIRVEFV